MHTSLVRPVRPGDCCCQTCTWSADTAAEGAAPLARLAVRGATSTRAHSRPSVGSMCRKAWMQGVPKPLMAPCTVAELPESLYRFMPLRDSVARLNADHYTMEIMEVNLEDVPRHCAPGRTYGMARFPNLIGQFAMFRGQARMMGFICLLTCLRGLVQPHLHSHASQECLGWESPSLGVAHARLCWLSRSQEDAQYLSVQPVVNLLKKGSDPLRQEQGA